MRSAAVRQLAASKIHTDTRVFARIRTTLKVEIGQPSQRVRFGVRVIRFLPVFHFFYKIHLLNQPYIRDKEPIDIRCFEIQSTRSTQILHYSL